MSWRFNIVHETVNTRALGQLVAPDVVSTGQTFDMSRKLIVAPNQMVQHGIATIALSYRSCFSHFDSNV